MKKAGIFVLLVAVLVGLGILIKLVFMIRQSTYDGFHRYTVTISSEQPVILSFVPNTKKITALKLSGIKKDDDPLKYIKFFRSGYIREKTPGILPNAKNISPEKIVVSTLLNYPQVDTSLTPIDLVRLWFFAKSVREYVVDEQEIQIQPQKESSTQNSLIDKTASDLFTDTSLLEENTTIEIVNASKESGIGALLARALTNSGASVISVTSDFNKDEHSSIEYFGKETYTLSVLKKMLGFPSRQVQKKSVAAITIRVGKDALNKALFQ